MANEERTNQIDDAISLHLDTVGACDWDEVKKDFPDISMSTFWRHVKRVKERRESKAAPSVTLDLFSRGDCKPDMPKPWEKPELNSAVGFLKHAERYYELHTDLLALRQHALDADGKIRDPQLFAKSVRLRNQLLNEEINVVSQMFNAGYVTKLYDAIVATLGKVSPEVARTVMVALKELDEEIKESGLESKSAPGG